MRGKKSSGPPSPIFSKTPRLASMSLTNLEERPTFLPSFEKVAE